MALLTQSLQKFLLGSVLLLASSLPPHLAQAADAQPRVVDVKQGKSMAERGALLLDVRELEEYQQGHAPNSRLLPLGQLNKRIAELDAYRDKPIAVICRSGRRSAQAVELLRQAGFTQVVNVQGGMNAWEAAALPVVKGKN
ncbi:MAG TPA: rhodanese-like domain-containing protein [Oxalobacteraceae bacterium]|nr:rhodanese-like domain-containing protein [Oxalobacteraceae bacterium]